MKNTTQWLITAAVAGMIGAGVTIATPGRVLADGTAKDAMVKCYGVNDCKGKSACATSSNDCKGENSCQGKGMLMMSKKECQDKGGMLEEEKPQS